MPIRITCPCGCQLRARDDQVGRQCKCPGCGSILIVPAPALPAQPVIVEEAEPEEPERIQLGYAGTSIGATADPLIHGGGDRPVPVIARPTLEIAKLDQTWRGNVWWMLVILMIPLAVVSLTQGHRMTAKERIEKTLEKHPDAARSFGREDEGYPHLDEGILLLPGKKLDGAFLQRHSVFPILYALIALAFYIPIATFAVPAEGAKPGYIFLTGLFTGTGGVLLLLGIQIMPVCCCIHAFYLAALHPDAPFGPSLIGFVFGIGVCEEIIKCLPILFMLWRGTLMNWRTACVIGMASGVGFGMSEAMLYCFRFYNGIETGDAYVLRFTSCIAFHVLLTGACAMLIQRKQQHLLEDTDPINWMLTLTAIILTPIFLHGLFDTFAKKDMEYGSFAVAAASFAWLAWLIRDARRREQSVAVAITPDGPKVIKTAKGTRWISPAPEHRKWK